MGILRQHGNRGQEQHILSEVSKGMIIRDADNINFFLVQTVSRCLRRLKIIISDVFGLLQEQFKKRFGSFGNIIRAGGLKLSAVSEAV